MKLHITLDQRRPRRNWQAFDCNCDPGTRILLHGSRTVSVLNHPMAAAPRNYCGPPPPLTPAEIALVGQTVASLGLSAWGLGGVADWVPPVLVALTLSILPIALLSPRQPWQRWIRSCLPLTLWFVYLGAAALNPSHMANPSGGWIPRSEWIPWLPTTVDLNFSLTAGLPWLLALAQGALLVAVRPSARAVRLIWAAVALNGAGLAAIGCWFHWARADQVLGFIEPPEPTYFFATFFYKNHWAAYSTLAAVAALALAVRDLPAALGGHPGRRGSVALFTATGLFTLVTAPLPGSRAGALLAMGILAGFLLAVVETLRRLPRGHRRPRNLFLCGATAAAILTFGLLVYAPRATVDWERTKSQLARDSTGEGVDVRLPVSRDTARLALARPWFGWGLGSFQIVFPLFQGDYLRAADGRPTARFEFAHNDWLQLWAEAGVAGAALLLLPASLLAWRAWRRGDPAGRLVVWGCALIGGHALIDFPFHNLAILLLWTALLGCAAVASHEGNDHALPV